MRQTVLHNMATLWQNMKQEASLCPVRCDKVVLMQEACKPDHMTDEMLVACTTHEAMVGNRV